VVDPGILLSVTADGRQPAAKPPGERNGTPRAAPPGWLSNTVFWLFWASFGVLLRFWFRIRVENHPRLRGAYVLAPNHASFLDPLLVGAVTRRRITFLMTEVIWRSPTLGWFYRWSRSLPVSVRSANRETLRTARTVLQQGRVICIFPEGGISRDGGLLLGNPGAVSLVLAEGVPVVPVGILGAHRAMPANGRFPWPAKVVVRFGEPIMPEQLAHGAGDRKGRLQAATRLIMQRLSELTGQPAREQQLAALRRR